MSTELELPGPEGHNLLAFLSLVGLLRALEEAEADWQPRLSWRRQPWQARLHLAKPVTREQVAEAANRGITAIAGRLDVFGEHSNVTFTRNEFRALAKSPKAAAVVGAVSGEFPLRRDEDRVTAAPLVMMFGQGHQHFLERLVAVPQGRSTKKDKGGTKLDGADSIARCLFRAWTRADEVDGFRWDPQEDQRYALRFDNPSRAGAAATENGANRLAAVGLLSFQAAPASRRLRTTGFADGAFVWPLWLRPWSLTTIEQLLRSRELLEGRLSDLTPYGVFEAMRAHRVTNGKFVNVARAVPFTRDVD